MSEIRHSGGRLTIGAQPMLKRAVMPGFKISRAVAVADWFFTSGQMDYGEGGKVCNPHDLVSQTMTSMRSVYELMAKAGSSLSDLAQLQVFYLAGSVLDEAAYRAQLVEEFPECRDVLLVFTPVSSFATVGSEVEIDAIAVKGSPAVSANHGGDAGGVRRGDWVFASSRVQEGVIDICADLRNVLADLQCGIDDVCRLYAYLPADLSEADRRAIEHRLADTFRHAPPAYHAALLPSTSNSQVFVELEVIANSNARLERIRFGRATPPTSGGDWPFAEALRCGDIVFVSGQFPIDESGSVSNYADSAAQARIVMRRLEDALKSVGAKMADLTKIKTYYVGGWDEASWKRNLIARMESLSDPGPSSSGLDGLLPAMPGALLSVDGIAIVDPADVVGGHA